MQRIISKFQAIDWAVKSADEGGGGFSADDVAPESDFVGTTLAQVEAQVETEVPCHCPRMAAFADVNAATRASKPSQ